MIQNLKFSNWGKILILGGMLELGILIQELSSGENLYSNVQNFSATEDYSSEIEKQIRAGITTTADLVVNHHPRFWIRGNWDWDAFDEEGTFAWRFLHGYTMANGDPANDQLKHEVFILVNRADNEDIIYGEYEYATFARRFLWVIIAAEMAKRGDSDYNISENLIDGRYVTGSSTPVWPLVHTEDELLMDARLKLLLWHTEPLSYPDECHSQFLIHASAGYDWLVDRKFSDGVTPVLSDSDKQVIQEGLISVADMYREYVLNNDCHLLDAGDICWFSYVAVGLALYEPDEESISAEYNAKAKQYLDDFDKYWIGQILPAMNEQGGTGGWHGGLSRMGGEWWNHDDHEDVLTYRISPLLFAHYTATGQEYRNSLMSSGCVKYAIEFQNYMIYPDGKYVPIGPQTTQRYQWIGPYFSYARRRFSLDMENQRQAEMGGWLGIYRVPPEYHSGSYDLFDQAMFEEKWPDPRSPELLECGTRHFAKLGWVAMRSGFNSAEDLAALFICQRFHWGNIEPYAQNSFHLMRGDWLIEGNINTIYINDQYQRTISDFPTIAEGAGAYSEGSVYDVGPGILAFESNEQYDYIFGDATNAYNRTQLQKYTRQILYLKPDKFLILDKVITTDAALKKSWIINPGSEPQAIGDTLILIDNTKGSLWIKRLFPIYISQTLTEDRIEIVPLEAMTEDFFLFVLQATDPGLSQSSTEVVADQAKLLVGHDKLGARLNGWNILFNTSDFPGVSINEGFNDSPAFFNLPDVSFPEDSMAILDLNRYTFDLDHSDDELNFSASIIDYNFGTNGKHKADLIDNRILDVSDLQISIDPTSHITTFAITNDSSGIFNVSFTVSDPEGLSDTDTIQVTVTPVNDAPLISELPSISFNEDETFDMSISQWYDYVEDIDNIDNTLDFAVQAGNYVQVSRQGASYIFTSPRDFFGEDILQLIVSDPEGLSDLDTFRIIVHAINDPPVITGLPDSVSFWVDSLVVLDIWSFTEDVETADSLLEYMFVTKYQSKNIIDSLLIDYNNTSGALTLSSSGFKGKSYLIITVEDDSAARAKDSIQVHVKFVPPNGDIEEKIPEKYTLYQNYPNPFNAKTKIIYDVVYPCRVKLILYDVTGKEIKTIVNEEKTGGSYEVFWDGTNNHNQQVSSGIYFFSLDILSHSTIPLYRQTKKMLLLR